MRRRYSVGTEVREGIAKVSGGGKGTPSVEASYKRRKPIPWQSQQTTGLFPIVRKFTYIT